MKKALLVLLTVFMSVLSCQLSAQSNSTTVADGTETNSKIPLNGLYCDWYTISQVIYPESMLTDLIGATISQMDFYLSSPASELLTSNFEVKLGTTTAENFASSALDAATTTTVYTGTLNTTASVMTITFTTPFTYTGGNLLLEISNPAVGSNCPSSSFLGISSLNASINGNKASLPISSYTRYSFIPKTTFTYTGGATCLSPIDLVVSNITSSSADVSFTPRNGATSFEICCVTPETDVTTATWTSVYDTFYSIQGLTDNTTYKIYVRTDCGSEVSAAVSTSFTTLCLPVAISDLPYTEGFESYSTGASSPISPCWYRYTNSTGSSYPYVYASAAHNGSNGLYFYSSSNYYVALPQFEENLTSLQLSFYQKASSSYYAGENFYVGIMSDPNDLSTFEIVYTGQTTTDWTLVEVPFSAYLGTGMNIAVRTSSNMYCDDFVVDYLPSCLTPANLVASGITHNGVTLNWTENGTATAWNLTFMSSTDTTTTVATSNQDFEVSNLNAGTTYTVAVNADCGSETSNSIYTSFTTLPAAPATVPYTCDFEDATESANWFFANDTYTNQWVIGTADNNTTGGTTAMYISDDNGTSNSYTNNSVTNVWAYRDVYFAPAAEYTLSFDWKCNGEYLYGNYYDYFKVYIGNPEVPSGSTAPAGSVNITSELNQQTTWQTATYTLGNTYSGTTKRIYFYWRNDTSGGSDVPAIIDNIQISTVACGTPSDLEASNISATSADIHWNAAFDTDSQWEVVYDTAGFDPNQAAAITAYDTTMTLDNLNADTDYEVYIRTDCGSGNYSNWTNVYTFTTLCAPEVAPYSEDFTTFSTTFPNCWKRYSGLASTTTTQTSSLTSTTSGWDFSNNKVFGAGHGKVNVYGTTCKYWLVSPIIDLSAIATPVLTFDLALTAWNSEDPITNPNNVADDKFIVFISTDNGSSWNMSNATMWNNDTTSAHVFSQISAAGEEVSIDLSQYAGQNIVVAFYTESTISGGDNDLHIDNLYVGESVSCAKPSGLAVTELTNNSITISWTENGTATAWNVEYGAPNFTQGTGTTVQVTDTFVTISNLTANTEYQFYVQSNCGGETSLWSSSLVGRTSCDAQSIPFTDNFDSYSTGNTPDCWTSLSTYTTSYSVYPYVNATHSSSPNGLYFYNGSASTYCMIATPEIENTVDINTLELTFNYYSSSSSAMMEVGVMSNLADASTFVSMDTINGSVGTSSSWVEQTVNLGGYTGTGHYIAFKLSGNSYISAYIDDVDLHLIPSCPKPIDFVSTNVTNTDASFTWQEVGSATAWEIEYGTTGYAVGSGTVVSATSTTTTVSGLTASTNYDFYVRAACAQGEESMWVGPVHVQTAVCAPADQCAYTIIASDSYGDGWDGSSFDIYQNGILVTYVEAIDHEYENVPTSDTIIVMLCDNAPTTFTWTTNPYAYYDDEAGVTVIGPDGTIIYQQNGMDDVSDPLFTFTTNCNNVTPTPCDVPAGLAVGNIAQTTATATWTAGDATAWDLQYKLASATDWGTIIPLTTAHYNFTGLTANTAYQVRVRANCGDVQSDWSVEVSFTTLDNESPEPCDAPSNLTTSDVTANSVMLSWTENGTATSWTVNYKEDGVSTWSTATANTTTYTLSGLNATTAYSAYVVANCADGSSDPSNTVTFTTLSDGSGIEAYELSTTLYPNPNNGQFTIRNAQFTMNSVSVYDVYGKLLMTVEVNGNEATINATAFANGMYFARIATEKGVVTKSFVKK